MSDETQNSFNPEKNYFGITYFDNNGGTTAVIFVEADDMSKAIEFAHSRQKTPEEVFIVKRLL